jgi:hypothetical protein
MVASLVVELGLDDGAASRRGTEWGDFAKRNQLGIREANFLRR